MRGFDRISRLPDEILHRILSSLPTTQEAVRTSILSKRWRHLYLSLSSLSLDLGLHLNYDFKNKKRGAKRSRPQYDPESLRLFLGGMLQHLDNSSIQMQTLRLSWWLRKKSDEALFDECLRVAAKRSVQHLDLSLCPGNIPPWLFASQSLLTLRLCACKIDLEDLNSACLLRRLTALNLVGMSFGMSSAAKLISGCPALLHLTMISCFVDGDLDISSHTLQTLNLTSTDFSGVLSVSASALVSFNLNMVNARACTLRDLSSLVRLSIEALPGRCSSLDILEALHNVQELKLGSYALQALFGKIISQGQSPTFSRLKRLELNTYIGRGPIQAIACILQCFPSLEELVITECVITECEGYSFDRNSFVLSEPSEDFLGNQILVKIHGFRRSNRKGKATKVFVNLCLSNAEGHEKKLIAKLFGN